MNCACGFGKFGKTVECIKCGEWRHLQCADIEGEFDSSSEYRIKSVCEKCFDGNEEDEEMLTPGICLLESCTEKAMEDSKFCGETHATEYFESKILESLEDCDFQTFSILKQKALAQILPTPQKTTKINQTIPPEEFPSYEYKPTPNPPTYKLHKPTPTLTKLLEQARASEKCGFSPSYFEIVKGRRVKIDNCCEELNCTEHTNWIQMIEARARSQKLTKSERKLPNNDWVQKNNLLGTIRVHTSFGDETENFIPHIWTDNPWFLG